MHIQQKTVVFMACENSYFLFKTFIKCILEYACVHCPHTFLHIYFISICLIFAHLFFAQYVDGFLVNLFSCYLVVNCNSRHAFLLCGATIQQIMLRIYRKDDNNSEKNNAKEYKHWPYVWFMNIVTSNIDTGLVMK